MKEGIPKGERRSENWGKALHINRGGQKRIWKKGQVKTYRGRLLGFGSASYLINQQTVLEGAFRVKSNSGGGQRQRVKDHKRNEGKGWVSWEIGRILQLGRKGRKRRGDERRARSGTTSW